MKLVKISLLISLVVLTNSISIQKEAEKNLVNDKTKSVKVENKQNKKAERKTNLKSKADDLVGNEVGKFTTFDKDTEAETTTDADRVGKVNDVKENKPVPLKERLDIKLVSGFEDPALKANNDITGVGILKDPPKKVVLEPVTYVKELSPAGKASLELQESGDIEYQKLLNAGFESPKTITPIIPDKETRVVKAANAAHLWRPIDPTEKNFWADVEFNKYNNRLLDVSRYYTQAKFEKNMFGNIIVHAPSDSNLMITSPAKVISHSGFLSVDEKESFDQDINFLDTSEMYNSLK